MPLKSVAQFSKSEYYAARDALLEDETNSLQPTEGQPDPTPELDPTLDAAPETAGNFSRGFSSGVDNMQALYGGGKALLGSAFSNEEMVADGMAYYQEKQAEAQQNLPDSTFGDIDSASDFGAWAAYTLGSAVPDLAGMVVGGGLATLATKAVVKKGATEFAEKYAKDKAEALVERGISEEMAQSASKEIADKIVADQLAAITAKAGTLGAGLYAGQQGASSTFARTLEETGEEAPMAALASGALQAAINAIPVGVALTKFLPKGKSDDAVEFISGSISDKGAWFGSFLKDVVAQSGMEGVTEALQYVVEEEVISYVNNNFTENEKREYFDYLSNERKRKGIIEQAAGGTLFGFATGTAGASVKAATGGYDSDVNMGDGAKIIRTQSVNDPEFGARIREMYDRAKDDAANGRTSLGEMVPSERPIDPVTGELATTWNAEGALDPDTNRPYTDEQLNQARLLDFNAYEEPIDIPDGDLPEPALSADTQNSGFGENTLPPSPQPRQADIVDDFKPAPAFGGVVVSEGTRDAGPAHRWDGELSPVDQPVQEQLMQLSMKAATPEAMDPNNTDVIVEAIDQDDVDRIFDRNESLKIATTDKPKGKSLPTIDEVYGDDAAQVTNSVAGVMADLSANGVPKSFMDSVTGVYVHKEAEVDAPALTGRQARGISVNEDLLSGSLTDTKQLSELAWTMTHEVYHAADFAMGLSDKDSRFGIEIDEAADAPTVVMGDIMQEIYDNWVDGTAVGERFDYPFNNLADDIENLEKDNAGLNVNYREEVFAQLGALFHSNPKQLQELAPQAYNYIKDIRDSNLQTAVVQETANEPSPSQENPDTTQPEGISGEVRAPPESGSIEVVQPESTGSDGEASLGDGRADTSVEGQVQEEAGQRERPAVQEPKVKKKSITEQNVEASRQYAIAQGEQGSDNKFYTPALKKDFLEGFRQGYANTLGMVYQPEEAGSIGADKSIQFSEGYYAGNTTLRDETSARDQEESGGSIEGMRFSETEINNPANAVDDIPIEITKPAAKGKFTKSANWQDTGNLVATFADGDRYTVYFDDQAKDAGDEVYYTSVDGKIPEDQASLGQTQAEALRGLQEHRQKLFDAGEKTFNTPLDPDVGNEVEFKAWSFIDDKGSVTEKQLRAKFKSLEDNQFENLKQRLLDENKEEEDTVILQDGKFMSYEYLQEKDLDSLQDLFDDPSFIAKSDLPEVAQKITASDVLYGDESLDIVGTSRNGATVVVDLARAFDARVKDANQGKNLGEQNDENAEVLSDLIAHEAVQAMKTDGNAGEWYQEKVANAMSMAATEFPELNSDPNAKFAFTSIMAITSNGASVPENSVNTFDIYEEYRQSKVFPDFGVGKEAGAMKNAFALLNALIDKQGIDATRKFMDRDVTVKELKDVFDLSVSGELMGTKLKGSAIIGPKIGGGFYQNLNGNFDPLTMDRWFMRTWGRLSGTLMADAERKLPVQLAKFREVALGDSYRAKLKKDGINRSNLAKDDQYATSYATKVQAAYANGGFKEKSTINKASNTFKNSQGEKQAPQNGKEREYIRSVMRKALDKVNATSGQDPVNMGALQAIIWYPEKDLYKQLGVGNAKSEPTDYETEFGKIVQSRQERGQGVSGSVGTAQQSGAGGLESNLQSAFEDADQRDGGQDRKANQEIETPPEEVSFIQKKVNNAKNKTLDDGSPSTNAFSYNDEIDGQADLSRRLKNKPIYKSLVDKYAQLEDFEAQAAEYLGVGRLPAELSPRDQENLAHGKVQNALNDFHENFVDPLGDLIAELKADPDAIGTYLIAKHAAERNDVIAGKVREQRDRNIARTEKQIESLLDDVESDHTVQLENLAVKLKGYKEDPLLFQDTGSGMTYDEAQSVLNLAEREGTKADMERIASKVYDMLKHQREIMVSSGLMDADSVADWEATYEFYVPLKGFAAEPEGDTYKRTSKANGFSVVGSESMKAKGRKTLPVNPLFTAIEDVQMKIIRAQKNQTAQTFLDLLSKLGNSDSYTIYNNKFRPPKDSDHLTMQDLDQMARDTRTNGDPKYVQVKKGGQTFFIHFKSDTLNHALQDMSVAALDRNNTLMDRALTYATRFQTYMRNMLINYNPSWGLVNPARDVQTGLMYVLGEMDKKGSRVQGENLIGKMAQSYLPSMRAMYRTLRGKPVINEMGKYAAEFMEDGASTGMMLVRDQAEQLRILKNKLKRGYTREALTAIGDWVEAFNTTMENAVRLAAYTEARKAGTDRQTAATLAKDLTVNFNRKGENTAQVNAGYLFFGAAVQGNVNFAQTLASDKGAYTAARGAAAGLVVLGTTITVMNILSSEEDEDGERNYADLPEHAKNRSLLFMYSDQEGFALPASYGYNFFTNIGRLSAEMVFGINTPEQSAQYLAENVLLNFVPISPSSGGSWEEMARGFYPDLLEVHLDMLANKNFFGSDIYIEQNPFMVERSNAYNSRRSTDKAFTGAAKFLNDATGGDKYEDGVLSFNPDKMQYVFEYFTGGVGRFVSQTGDVAARMMADEEFRKQDLPVIGTFFESPSEYEDRFEFYANWEESRKIEARLKEASTEEELVGLRQKYQSFIPVLDGGRNSPYKTASRELRNISKTRKIVETQNISEERRREMLKKLLDAENKIFDLYNKMYRKAEKGIRD